MRLCPRELEKLKLHNVSAKSGSCNARLRLSISSIDGSVSALAKRLNRAHSRRHSYTQAGFLAQKRLARGVRLNYPGGLYATSAQNNGVRVVKRLSRPHSFYMCTYTEAVALIATVLMEKARDGDKTVAELMDMGRSLLGHRQVRLSINKSI